ncbi:MAG: single-stranded-DNA-specific exonuclease RecJ [Christensenellales bacterium]
MRFLPRHELNSEDSREVRRLMDAGYDEIIARLLTMREIYTPRDAQAFLNPSEEMLHDPFLLSDMDKAVKRIESAVAKGESIVIYGDYDADGVTAVAILKGYFNSLGAKADYYIPSRHFEGYGLNNAAIETLAQSHSLMITVDCGIDCFHEVERAKELGLDIIITDHHQLKELLPGAVAVINPLRGNYPCRKLCGAGVALKLVQALGGMEAIRPLIDLAAIGTVADIVPLLGENRAITALGLQRLNAKMRRGINAICKAAGLRGKVITSGHIGYMIGPRINAGGRIDRSAKSVDLLLTDDEDVAMEIAAQLEEHNSERQRLERQITVDCEQMLNTEVDFTRDSALILMSEGWNLGVVGIVASRLAERWSMPVLLFAKEGDSITGSGRSVSGVHIFKAISACSHLLTRFGGHEMAAGLTMPVENFEKFKDELNAYLKKNVSAQSFVPKAYYDIEISASQINMQLCRQLDQLLPFGLGNPTPTFLLKEIRAKDIRLMGAEQQHIKCLAGQDESPGHWVDCVGFSMADRVQVLLAPADMLVQLGVNEWNDRVYLQTIIRNMAPAKSAFTQAITKDYDEIMLDFLRAMLYCDDGEKTAAKLTAMKDIPELDRGDMLICADPANINENMLEKVYSAGAQACFVAAPDDDKRAFPCLVTAPLPGKSSGAFGAYDRFIFIDRPWAPLVKCILAHNPGAEVAALENGDDMTLRLPTREDMVRIYSYIVARAHNLNLCLSLREAGARAADDLEISPLEFMVALEIFAELSFIAVDMDRWRLEVFSSPEKRELSQSRLWRLFQECDNSLLVQTNGRAQQSHMI